MKSKTKEQEEFYNKIAKIKPLQRRKRERRNMHTVYVERKLTSIDYLKNCMFWMNEYFEGREGKERFKKTLTATREHCTKILSELEKPDP